MRKFTFTLALVMIVMNQATPMFAANDAVEKMVATRVEALKKAQSDVETTTFLFKQAEDELTKRKNEKIALEKQAVRVQETLIAPEIGNLTTATAEVTKLNEQFTQEAQPLLATYKTATTPTTMQKAALEVRASLSAATAKVTAIQKRIDELTKQKADFEKAANAVDIAGAEAEVTKLKGPMDTAIEALKVAENAFNAVAPAAMYKEVAAMRQEMKAGFKDVTDELKAMRKVQSEALDGVKKLLEKIGDKPMSKTDASETETKIALLLEQLGELLKTTDGKVTDVKKLAAAIEENSKKILTKADSMTAGTITFPLYKLELRPGTLNCYDLIRVN